MWWFLLVIQAFGKLRQKDYSDFKASVGYSVRPYFKQNRPWHFINCSIVKYSRIYARRYFECVNELHQRHSQCCAVLQYPSPDFFCKTETLQLKPLLCNFLFTLLWQHTALPLHSVAIAASCKPYAYAFGLTSLVITVL